MLVSYRVGDAATRALIEAPAHLFARAEGEDAISFVTLGVLFLWDVYVVATVESACPVPLTMKSDGPPNEQPSNKPLEWAGMNRRCECHRRRAGRSAPVRSLARRA